MAVIQSAYTGTVGTVLQPSGDTSGVTDANNINNALAKLNTGIGGIGGMVTCNPSGKWNIACGTIVNSKASNVTLNMPGCYVNCVGSGDAIRLFDNSTYNSRNLSGGGIIGWPIFDGTNTTGNASAVHIGDIVQLKLYGMSQNFTAGTTSKGLWADNQIDFTERLTGQWFSENCTTNIQFDNSTGTGVSASATGSFDRMIFDTFISQNGTGDGVVFANGATTLDHRLGIYGNFNTAASAHAVLKFTGSNAGGSSGMSNGILWNGTECDDAVQTPPNTIKFNAGSNFLTNVQGFLDYSAASPFTTVGASPPFKYFGPAYGDANMAPLQNLLTQSLTVAGANAGTIFSQWFGVVRWTNAGTGLTGVILQAGGFDSQQITVRNIGAGSLTFAAAGTSNVAGGTGVVIAANSSRVFSWDATGSLWY